MTPHSPRRSIEVVEGLAAFADRYDVVLCDVWGVVHDGQRAFSAAVDALTRFRHGGGTVVLLTNAPRPNGPVVEQLDRLGVPRGAYDAIVTSGDATLSLIAARGEAPVHHIGPERDLALFDELRDSTGLHPPLVGLDAARHVVCTGLVDDATQTPDDYAAILDRMRGLDLEMTCANPDVIVHIGDRIVFCGGALAERYETLGGTVRYAGKPHAPIYEVALIHARTRRGAAPDPGRVLAIGDALRTDMAGAHRQGIDSLFVAAGIHREDSLDPSTGRIDPARLRHLFSGVDGAPVGAITALEW